ncbi:MAG: IS256 family transposase [Oceanivirga sp.]|nr:IS256 family transposase [Oceanivirga sp.]
MVRKREVHKIVPTEGKRQLVKALMQQYDITDATSIEDALKDLLGQTIKEVMEAEMDDHIGTSKNKQLDDRDNYRNGYRSKKVRSAYGEFDVEVPQDRNSNFEPEIVPKRKKDISRIENIIISMYARGNTTRDISDSIEELYGFTVDENFVSRVTDKILPMAEEWNSRPIDTVYPIVFIDATVFSVRDEGKVSKKAAYVIMGINKSGIKDVLSIEIGDTVSAKFWFGVLNSLKNRGLKDILILCSDRLTGIKEAIEAVYPNTDWQGCIVHMIRNTLRYVSYKHLKEFSNDLKTIYTANTEEEALKNLDKVKEKWDKVYMGCMDRWYDNWSNIAPMFAFSKDFRKIVYTTNAIESLNSQYKRLNKSRTIFPNKVSLFKALYLSTDKIVKKWNLPIRNWGIYYSELTILYGRERLEVK